MRSKTSSNPSSYSLFSGFALLSISRTTATNGIVIATEKKAASPLIDDSMIEKVSLICPNIGMVYSGMGPDYRVLVAKARKSAQAYWKIYGEYPPTRVLVQEIATVMQEATQSGCVNWKLTAGTAS
jgi:20S proteasome subunit alpha 2